MPPARVQVIEKAPHPLFGPAHHAGFEIDLPVQLVAKALELRDQEMGDEIAWLHLPVCGFFCKSAR